MVIIKDIIYSALLDRQQVIRDTIQPNNYNYENKEELNAILKKIEKELKKEKYNNAEYFSV